ncbi:MAG: family transporter [Ilumatobacteraceae bacterium]|nr:family transporter [Ilumatobacteraceae bacterium]
MQKFSVGKARVVCHGGKIVPGFGSSNAYSGSAMSHGRIPFLASAFALSAGVVWSFGAVTARKADQADAFQYLIWRSIGIIIVIEVLARIKRRPPVTPVAFRSGRLMMMANVMLLLASIAFVYALKTTSAANAAFLASMTPLIAVVGSRIFLGERMSRITIAAIGIGLIGLTITVWGDLDAGNMAGNISAVMSSVGFAGYTVCLRTEPDRDWSPVMPGYAVMMIVICSIVTLANGHTLAPPAADIGYALLHGGLFIVVGTLLYNVAARQVPAVAMVVFAQTEMIFVPVWAVLFLSENPKGTTLIGGGIIFAAVIGKAIVDATAKHPHPVLAPDPALTP